MADIPTTYKYRVYNGAAYLGLLQNVTSEFNYSQSINTTGAQIVIELGTAFPDVDANTVVTPLVDGSGNNIVDGQGNRIVTSRTYSFTGAPINLGNRVIVMEYSSYYPSGTTVFDGFIFDWGAGYQANTTTLTVISHGVRLDNYIVDPSTDINTAQNSYNTEIALSPAGQKPVTASDLLAQTFELAAAVLLSTISIYLRKSSSSGAAYVALSLIEGTPSAPGAVLGTVQLFDLPSTSASLVDFTFSTPIAVRALTAYHFRLENNGGETSGYALTHVQYQNSNVYSGGQMFTNPAQAGYVAQTADVAFTIITTTGSVASVFAGADPSNITRTALDVFNSKGGLVTYSGSSIDNTGLSVDYNFLLSTVMETAKKGYELAPSSWWWYVNVATNLFHLHDSADTPDHTFVLGKHLNDLKISQSLSTMKNIIYFSGGEVTPGVNLFRINQDQSSINNYGQWLDRISDNRVTITATADLASLARLGKFSSTPFNVQAIIPAQLYNINTITLGQMVALENFNNLVDTLLLQVIETRRYPDRIELKFGIPAVRNSKLADDMQRRLIQLETVNNPAIET